MNPSTWALLTVDPILRHYGDDRRNLHNLVTFDCGIRRQLCTTGAAFWVAVDDVVDLLGFNELTMMPSVALLGSALSLLTRLQPSLTAASLLTLLGSIRRWWLARVLGVGCQQLLEFGVLLTQASVLLAQAHALLAQTHNLCLKFLDQLDKFTLGQLNW